jgi:hypothetical protein
MAQKALNHQMNRTVRVNRLKLLQTLKENREKHLAVYTEAMAGYKAIALQKVNEAFDGLETRLKKRKDDFIARIEKFTPETADAFSDYLVVLEQVGVNLKKPVSYVDAYDAAIDMALFDIREELDLSGAEFQCFCRDVWDWSYEFTNTNLAYSRDSIGSAR